MKRAGIRSSDHKKETLVSVPESNKADTPDGQGLGGQYVLRPGMPQSVVGQRPVLGAGRLGRLLRGQGGEQVSRTLTSLFSLCAHAHRRTAAMALAAAQSHPVAPLSPEPSVLLWIETARDHLRAIALDWPQRLPEAVPGAPNLDWLRGCPLSLATARPLTDADAAWAALAALRVWLEQEVLHQTLAQWLAAHRHPDALADWCMAQSARLPPARCLAAWHPVASVLTPAMRRLDLLDADLARQTTQLHRLAQSLEDESGFAQLPTWLGRCAETGPWARQRHQHGQAPTPHSAWTRLSARWVELMELALTDRQNQTQGGVAPLASGALGLGDGRALAWSEMARGLLLHWVQLAPGAGVQAYRVLAPTEWNFHPEGALAHALAALEPLDIAAARTLAAAFDPCVAFTIQTRGSLGTADA